MSVKLLLSHNRTGVETLIFCSMKLLCIPEKCMFAVLLLQVKSVGEASFLWKKSSLVPKAVSGEQDLKKMGVSYVHIYLYISC